jgi:hypothetical protein
MSKGTTLLVSTPDNQREHVLGILEGLSDGQLRRPVLPSRWTCLGMVRHLTLNVERFSFREIVAGESFDPADPDLDADAARRVPAEMSAEAVSAGTARRSRARTRSSPRLPSTPHPPRGPTTSGRHGDCTICGRSSST